VASLLALVTFASVNAALLRPRFTRPDRERPFRVPPQIGRWPVLTVFGFIVVLLILTRFELRAYGIAAVMLTAAFGIQALPWERGPMVRGTTP
jgi:hypothetical protein